MEKRSPTRPPPASTAAVPSLQGLPSIQTASPWCSPHAPEDSEGRYRVRKLAIHLEESVWEAVYAFLSQPAAERAPSTLQTHLTQKDAWALADTLRGAGAEVQVLDSTIPDVPQPHPFEGCRAMDFGKTVAAVILGVLAAQLILLPLALLLS